MKSWIQAIGIAMVVVVIAMALVELCRGVVVFR